MGKRSMSTERPAAPDSAHADRRFSLGDLTRAAGVSVRTVRYYIAEGLLPPPTGGGPGRHYTAAHLDRLRLIARLKAAYLPLREIRRRLAGLDEAEVGRLLAPGPPSAGAEPAVDDAAAYLDRVLGANPAPSPSGPVRRSSASGPAVRGLREPDSSAPGTVEPAATPFLSASASMSPPDPPPADAAPAPMLGRAYPASFPIHPEAATDADAEAAREEVTAPDAWRRVPLGDDAELLIRDGAYRRRRDRVEWLIAWAQKVFD